MTDISATYRKSQQKCVRCNGSGEIGKRGEREAPGPVPDDARAWAALGCPDCNGAGVFFVEDEDHDDA